MRIVGYWLFLAIGHVSGWIGLGLQSDYVAGPLTTYNLEPSEKVFSRYIFKFTIIGT